MNRTMWSWMGFAGVVMSLGWGLRGYIGGGPLGAMIPGAMVALALCLLLDREDVDVALIAAFGAVGVGFGGQMTYGQTIGLSFRPETMYWGLLGLGLKGAVWGMLGGAIIGLALVRDRFKRTDIVIALLLMLVGVFLGWKLINEPKLIYFSNRLDKPRPEIWAGLTLGALGLLGWLEYRGGSAAPRIFSAIATVGGGLGFLLGGWLQVAGRGIWPTPLVDWWKVMEFTFGFLFGCALGLAAWRTQGQLRRPATASPAPRNGLAYALAFAVGVAVLARWLPFRFAYTVAGAALLAIASTPSRAGWHIAITMTCSAFFFDLLKVPGTAEIPGIYAALAACCAITFLIVERAPRPAAMFLYLTVVAVVDSVVKSILQDAKMGHVYIELAFVAMMAVAVVYTVQLLRTRTELRLSADA